MYANARVLRELSLKKTSHLGCQLVLHTEQHTVGKNTTIYVMELNPGTYIYLYE